MRFSRPSTGTLLGGIAVFIALGGTAFAAGATVVNIADPTTPANVAHVTPNGQLATSVGNDVLTQLATPSSYFNTQAYGLFSSDGCLELLTAPAKEADIIRDIKVDTFDDPSPGPEQNVAIWTGPDCAGTLIADVNPATVGETVVPFDPGYGVPAGGVLSVIVNGGVEAEVYIDGYSVPASQVPALPARAVRARARQ